MLSLIAVGLAAGIITGLSPCVLPVLPGVLAAASIGGGAPGEAGPTRARSLRRALLIVAGLLTSFTLAMLFGGLLLGALGLPASLLQTLAIAALIIVGIGLLFPVVGTWIERPFARLANRGPRNLQGSAFLIGITFGLVFVPCAGPVLAAITVLSATAGVSVELLVLTISFALGAAIPLLAIAFFGTAMGRALRQRMPIVRRVAGAVLILTAVSLQLGWSAALARNVPSYLADIQRSVEDSQPAREVLGDLSPSTSTVAKSFDECSLETAVLRDCGPAPEFVNISEWINTPGGAPITLADRKGKVTLVDFWTYSCINCLRTLPYLQEWQRKYQDAGFTIIGVHTPEFDFERDPKNVRAEAEKLGVTWPIAIDNNYGTWTAFENNYWPAKYLIDQNGNVRQVHFGEGAYDETEALIRELLADGGAPPAPQSSASAQAEDPYLSEPRSPETYLGYDRAEYYMHDINPEDETTYPGKPAPELHGVTLSGKWTVRGEHVESGSNATLDLAFVARNVFLVLAGEGTVTVAEPGQEVRTIKVTGTPTLYTLRTATGAPAKGSMSLTFTPGIKAYAFTFG